MKSFIREHKLQLLGIVGLSLVIVGGFLFTEYTITDGSIGAPLDDVYIHFQFSRNIVEGHGFSFNPDVPTPGSTSPAWTLLLSFFYNVIRNHLLIAKVSSVVFYILTGFATYLLGLSLTKSKKYSLLASLFVLTVGRMAWSALSGMEITLFATLLTLFLYLHIKKYPKWLLGLTLGLGSTVRPEGYVLFVFFLLTELISHIRTYRSKKTILSFRPVILSVLMYLVCVVPYFVFSYKTTGNILPNTFLAQSIADASIVFRIKNGLLYVARYCYLLITDNPLMFLLLPIGFFSILKQVRKKPEMLILLLFGVGYPLVAAVTAPNLRHHGRYIIPFIPLYSVVGVLGLQAVLHNRERIYKRLRLNLRMRVVKTILVLTVVYLLISLFSWAQTLGWNTKNINDLQIHLGHWVTENTHRDDVIAINDIGAITYISERQIIDTVGLVEPDIIAATKGKSDEEKEIAIWEYLQEKEPNYLVIFPSWYPYLAERPELTEIYRVVLDRYTIIDGEMVVYSINNSQ